MCSSDLPHTSADHEAAAGQKHRDLGLNVVVAEGIVIRLEPIHLRFGGAYRPTQGICKIFQ